MFDSQAWVELGRVFNFTLYSHVAFWFLSAILLIYWVSHRQRGAAALGIRTQAVWSLSQAGVGWLAVHSDFVILAVASVEIFFLSNVFFLRWTQSPRNLFVERGGHLLGLVALIWWAVEAPQVSWTQAAAVLTAKSGNSYPGMQTAFGLSALSLALRSGLLPAQAGNLRHSLQHLSTTAIPAMLFAWVLAERTLFSGFDFLSAYLLTLGLLVFVVFQIISQSRNHLSDVMANLKSAHVGWFWAFFALGVLTQRTDALFAFFWPALFGLYSLIVFFAWMENEGVENSERTLRGMLNTHWAAAFPGFIFLLGVSGQPWIGAAVLYPEALSQLLASGVGIAGIFAFGILLQSTKTIHLALVMVLPGGRRAREGMRLYPERSRVWLHWVLALAAVSAGVWPFFVRSVL